MRAYSHTRSNEQNVIKKVINYFCPLNIENTVNNALDLTKQYENIPYVNLNISKHYTKSILCYGNKLWIKIAAQIITTISKT